jgi:hypothetical protein
MTGPRWAATAAFLLAVASGVVLDTGHLPGHLWLAAGYLTGGVLLMLWAVTAPPAPEPVPDRLVLPGVTSFPQQTT